MVPLTAHVGPGGPARSGAEGLIATALRIPLFWKLLLAGLGVSGGTALAVLWIGRPGEEVAGLGTVLAVLAGVTLGTGLIQAVVLRIALSPLSDLESAAERVRDGDLSTRVAPSIVADARLDRLRVTVNDMLDCLESIRMRQRRAAGHMVGYEEDERDHIARDLYGGPAQTLAGLLLHLRALALRFPETGDAIAEFEGEVRAALEEVRSLARRLRPPELDELGLRAALEAHARIVPERRFRETRITGEVPDSRLRPAASLAIFRFAQRIMEAGTHPVEIRFETVRDGLVVDVSSGSAGAEDTVIDVEDWVERIAWAGGSLAHEPLPDGVERIRITMPLTPSGSRNHQDDPSFSQEASR